MNIYLNENIKIGAAVSGGVDSMVMLELLLRSKINTTVINIEHGIRGKQSRLDSDFVKQFCDERKIPCLLFSVDAIKYAKEHGISIELAARKLRYEIFDKLILDKAVDSIALAHHADDQVETVLLRLLRGTGIRGLRGIVDRENFIHPIIKYRKSELYNFANAHNIPYREDLTNKDNNYSRNFIRNEILPALEFRFPATVSSIIRAAENISEVEDYLLSQVTDFTVSKNGVSLPLSELERHPAIAKKSILECLRALKIDSSIEHVHLSTILSLKDKPTNSRINLPSGVDAILEYDKLVFVKSKTKTQFYKPFVAGVEYKFGDFIISSHKVDKIGFSTFDADKLPTQATIRTKCIGDSFKRIGGGTKSLSDYFTDIKLPSLIRDTIPVIAINSVILAIPGLAVADSLRVDLSTKDIYKFAISPPVFPMNTKSYKKN
ncbi:MAG: tRNA lysidine(34) synthetase TilS [Christensenellaceae bacterium]|jgi:tRNA(Ile)-lysidine synthase|nr:tRNA lysidine(34) synthetase TilS [Christensenellaceae bacterium]